LLSSLSFLSGGLTSPSHLGCGGFVPPSRAGGGCLSPSLSRLWWLVSCVFVFAFLFSFRLRQES